MADWEDVGGGWEEVAPKKGFLPSKEQLIGAGEAALNLATGAIGGGLGTLSGTIAGLRQHGAGTEEQRKKVEEEAAAQAAELTYMPRSEKGREYTENLGELFNRYVIPVAPMMAEFEGPAIAKRALKDLKKEAEKAGRYAPEVPLTPEEAAQRADILPENQHQMLGPQPQWENIVPEQAPAQRVGSGRQMELDLGVEQPRAFDEQGNPIPEAGVIQQDRPEVIQVSREGEAHITPEQQAEYERVGTITDELERNEAIEAQRQSVKNAIERGETGDLFADYVNQHRDYELFRDEDGKPLSRADFDTTVDNLAKEPSAMYVKPENLDLAYARYLDNFNGVQAGLFDRPTTALEMSQALKNDATARMVENHPLVKAADRFVNQEQQFLDQLKQQGASLDAIRDATRDVEAATERLAKTRENVEKGIKTGIRPSALRKQRSGGRLGQQRGSVSGDMLQWMLSLGLKDKFSKEALSAKRIPLTEGENQQRFLPKAVQDNLKDYTFERRNVEDIIQDSIKNNIPDIKATPLSDKFQAGGLYKSLETNNPIVRKTFAVMKEAHHAATKNIRAALQDPKEGLPALFRALSKEEAGDIWAFMKANEGKREFSASELKSQGFNEKQIHLYERFREVDNFVLEQINRAREAAGKEPISARVGHLAGQSSGDFRRLIYKTNVDGAKEIVGIVGSDVKAVLDQRVQKILEAHPEWSAGERQISRRTRRDNRQKAFDDAVELMAEKNPDTRELLDTYDRILKEDAYNFMNAKKHTMGKKGIFGTEGFKEGVTAWQNAKEGMASQVKYLEKMFNWSENSKAVQEIRPLLADGRLEMPNAKKWANDYIDRALGINSSAIGHHIDGLFNAVGDAMGVGPSGVQNVIGATKNVVNKYLLGFLNLGFLGINILQPMLSMPALTSLLKGRGVEAASLIHMPEVIYSFTKMAADERGINMGKLSKFEKEIQKEGRDRNIFGSEIFEHTSSLNKHAYRLNKLAEFGIPTIEGGTRGVVFTGFAHMLEKAGFKGRELFDIAENLTNQGMTDYSHLEAPSLYKEMGPLGEMAVTLQRYKHNSLSSMAALAREAGRNKNYKPLAVAMGTMLAFSGLTGMLGFNEADALYQGVTKLVGKPDTLTRLVMDNIDNDAINYGLLSAATNIDLSKRFGMNLFPDSPSGAIFPGISRIGDMATAAKDLVTNPDQMNAERFAQSMTPNSIKGMMERKFFEDESGLAHNPKTLAGTVQRTETDQMAKNFGLTGLNESKQKNRLYQETLVDKALTDKRNNITKDIFNDLYPIRNDVDAVEQYFTTGKGAELQRKFVENEGNVDNLTNSIIKFMGSTKLTAMQQKLLSVAAAQKEGDVQKAKRYVEMKESLEK